MTFGTRSTGSTSNQCQNVTIHNVSTIMLTKSLNARASADDDRKDTDLSSQAEVDTDEEAESSEAPAAGEGAGLTDAEAAERGLKQDSDGDEDASEDQEGNADGASVKGSGSEAGSDVVPDDASGTEADVLVLAAAPGRDGAETPEILLEGLVPPSSSALEDLDIDTLAALLPSLGFSGAQDSVVRLPASSVSTTKYHGPATILVVGVGTGWADTDPLAVTTDDEAALGHDQTGLLRRAAGRATRKLVGTGSAVLALPALVAALAPVSATAPLVAITAPIIVTVTVAFTVLPVLTALVAVLPAAVRPRAPTPVVPLPMTTFGAISPTRLPPLVPATTVLVASSCLVCHGVYLYFRTVVLLFDVGPCGDACDCLCPY